MTYHYGVTWKRYYILFVFLLMIYLNVFWHISISVVRETIKDKYKLNTVQEYALLILYDVLYFPGAIIAVILHNKFSLRTCIFIAALVQSIGTLIMILSFVHYTFFYFGRALWCIIYQTIVFATPLLVVKWFEDSKRVIMIVIWISATYLTTDHSYGLNYLIYEGIEDKSKNTETVILFFFMIKAGFCIVLSIIIFFTFPSRQKIPP